MKQKKMFSHFYIEYMRQKNSQRVSLFQHPILRALKSRRQHYPFKINPLPKFSKQKKNKSKFLRECQ